VVEEIGDTSDSSSAFHVPQKIIHIFHVVRRKILRTDGILVGDRHRNGALNAAPAHNWRGLHSAVAPLW
jgi:hypothetical protein